jgi:fatty acid desaturase
MDESRSVPGWTWVTLAIAYLAWAGLCVSVLRAQLGDNAARAARIFLVATGLAIMGLEVFALTNISWQAVLCVYASLTVAVALLVEVLAQEDTDPSGKDPGHGQR